MFNTLIEMTNFFVLRGTFYIVICMLSKIGDYVQSRMDLRETVGSFGLDSSDSG